MHYDKIISDYENRISLYVSGCDFNCYNCNNPKAKDYWHGEVFDEYKYKELIQQLKSPEIDGLNILGGEPLHQGYEDLLNLTKLVHTVQSIDKTVWLWTGFKWETIIEDKNKATKTLIHGLDYNNKIAFARYNLMKACNVVIDGQFIQALADDNLKYCGSSNQRIIDAKKSTDENIILYDKKNN